MSEKLDLKIGQTAAIKEIASEETVQLLARATGDYNPVHLDDAYAQTTRFGRRIIHGLFVAGMVSKLLGTRLPGEGTVLLRQEMKYRRPVYIGDEIEASVTVAGIDEKKTRVALTYVCVNQSNELVMEGSADVMV